VVPGIALFYAGLVRRKNALSTCALVLGSAAFVTLTWVLIGYSLAFTEGNEWLGSLSQVLLLQLSGQATAGHALAPSVPEAVFVLFQLAFAMVTVALIFGAVVERIQFRAAMMFTVVWTLVVYAPIAHWIWHPEGWLHAFGHMDYAGGTVVHLASGVAGLVLAGMTGARRGYGREPMPPHNLLLTIVGAGMLWVGWFGFNGGSAMQASTEACMAVLATQVAAGGGVVAWITCEWITRGQVSLLGLASGLLAGLICITPASGFVGVGPAMVIGVLGSVFCFFSVTAVKSRLGYDDSLDVFGLHGVAGLLGTVLTGLFQSKNPDVLGQTAVQLMGAMVVVVYVAIATWAIAWLIRRTMGLRVNQTVETEGLDLGQHGESLAA
jgi:Amt family ammonium transporter